MKQEKKGHVVLLMAPSGSGKNTVLSGLGDLSDQLYFAKTYTTRQPRNGTAENPKYVFVDRAEFERMIAAGEFIEWAKYSGNYYGTPKSEFIVPLEKGLIAFKEMELQGVEQIKRIIPAEQITVIYIDAGDWEALKARVVARAEISAEELEQRRLRYLEEVQFKPCADIVVANHSGKIAEAQAEFRNAIQTLIQSIN